MSNVIIDRQKIDILANAISDKSGVPVTMTLAEMVEAVDGIESNPAPTLQAKTYTVDSAGTETITADSGYDGLSELEVTVPQANPYVDLSYNFETVSGQRKCVLTPKVSVGMIEGFDEGFLETGLYTENVTINAVSRGTTITPTESSQTIGGQDYMMEGAVTVNAIPSNYVGSGITQRSSSDLTASGATVTVPSGYYSAQASKAVASGTAGTPTATKGSVSNHQVSVTPSVTNTAGYISGGTINGTAVTVSASELVSGSDTVTTNDTYDVTNLAELIVNVSGSGGVTVTDVANTTGTTCVITTGSAPSEDIPLNTELIDFTKVKSGYIVDGDTGEETVSQWSSCSDFTLIDPSMTFSYIGYQWYSIVFYDSGKSYISGFNMYQDTGTTITNDYAHGTLTPSKIPPTAKYVRIDSYPTNPSSTQLSLIRTA